MKVSDYYNNVTTNFENEYSKNGFSGKDSELYLACKYIMDMKGKRIRPALVMMAAEMFGGSLIEALHPAMAVEVFHNSTLVHDDIMDAADMRRGQLTVHKIYGINTAINSGNVMMSYAYKYLLKSDNKYFRNLVGVFNRTAIEVMEGQSMDMNFETRLDVVEADYLKMIEYKTSVLLAASLQLGAIVADATESDQQHIYNFGKNLGLAFQLKDDYLDAFGDMQKVGKQKGGDIINNKKTLLLIKAIEFSDEIQKAEIIALLNEKNQHIKVERVLDFFEKSGSKKYTENKIDSFFGIAIKHLYACNVAHYKKEHLNKFAEDLHYRQF